MSEEARQLDLGLARESREDGPILVSRLPERPDFDAEYAFAGLSRLEVTAFSHGLHKYPAKFIPQIPRWALEYESTGLGVVLDPFCGSGTTLVEAGLRGLTAHGLDISPLAVLLTRAKTADIHRLEGRVDQLVSRIATSARARVDHWYARLDRPAEQLGLHSTWAFWFPKRQMAKLLALREAITRSRSESRRDFLLVCLSSIAKSASFLDEDQIKVRYVPNKELADPILEFESLAAPALTAQARLAKRFREAGAVFDAVVGTATKLPFAKESIDRIVTSPPYINAVDYTMAHRYNLFLLGLIRPDEFARHRRDYIGLTERAVRAADTARMPVANHDLVDASVRDVWSVGTAVARNRAFVIHQYFTGMSKALIEMRRVVRKHGHVVLVVGTENRICGHQIPTARMLEELAHEAGFETVLRFYHRLANRSSMRLNRGPTGGQVAKEVVLVLGG